MTSESVFWFDSIWIKGPFFYVMSGSRDNIPEESKVQGDRVRTVKSNKQPKDKVSPSKELLSRIVA